MDTDFSAYDEADFPDVADILESADKGKVDNFAMIFQISLVLASIMLVSTIYMVYFKT